MADTIACLRLSPGHKSFALFHKSARCPKTKLVLIDGEEQNPRRMLRSDQHLLARRL